MGNQLAKMQDDGITLCARFFYFFLFIHLAVWSWVPTLVRKNFSMDAIEGLAWGHQLEWGYDKNPFMNAWLCRLAGYLVSYFNTQFFLYFFSQLVICLGLWAAWKLAKEFVSEELALISVLVLECIQYFNIHALDLSDNALEIGFWTALIYFFYQAIKASEKDPRHLKYWCMSACFAAGAMMTKYYSAILLLTLTIYAIRESKVRHILKTHYFPILLSLLLFTILISPHCFWLFKHDFVTFYYAIGRLATDNQLMNHWKFCFKFSLEQCLAFSPAALMLFLVWYLTHLKLNPERIAGKQFADDAAFQRRFLLYFSVGPFLLTGLCSIVFGCNLRAAWGQPLLTLWPLTLIYFMRFVTEFHLTPVFIKNFFATVLVLLSVMVIAYSYILIRSSTESGAIFPGKIIAEQLSRDWQNQFHKPLKYVAGSRWLAGNIAFYSKDKPAVYFNWDKTLSPWINDKDIRKYGALFVWDPHQKDTPSIAKILARYPSLISVQTQHFTWQRNHRLTPLTIQVAYLHPSPE